MIQFILMFSRQGKLRLQKWYEAVESKEKKKIARLDFGHFVEKT